MSFLLYVFLPIGGLLIAMLIASEMGRHLGIRHLARGSEGLAKGAGAAEAAVFALLGLLLAFTFSGAASRFEEPPSPDHLGGKCDRHGVPAHRSASGRRET